MNNLKLYIAILDEVPDEMVPVLVAHSVLGADTEFLRINPQCGNYVYWFDAGNYVEWKTNSFKKVTVKVNQKEFDKIAAMHAVYLGHENKTLDGKKSCAVVCPREEYPNVIKFAKLWKPNDTNQTPR